MNRKYEIQHAPDWVEEQQLDEASYVAFWGYGFLFKGKSPDQYIWVGSNQEQRATPLLDCRLAHPALYLANELSTWNTGMLVRIFQNAIIGLALFVAFLILAGLYLYNGTTPSCLLRGYDRVDWTVERPDESFRMGDGTGQSTIKDAILLPSGVKAFMAFKRITMLDNCALVSDLTHHLSFVELRSPQLTAAVQAWRAGANNASDFRAGTVVPHSDPTLPKDTNGDSRNSSWDPIYTLQNAPDWVEEQHLGQASFVAFWGSGHLFKGKNPDQYIWVGYD